MSSRSTTFTFIGEDKFSKVATQVERNAGGMGAKIGKVGKVAAVGMAAVGTAAVAAGAALVSMAKDAAADEKSQARLATVLKNTTGATESQVAAVEEWISKTGEATGVADDRMRPAMQRLVAATGNVGEAQTLMATAMDTATATGTDLETVAKALARAHDGNVGALGRLGIATKDADGKALSFDQTVANMNKTFGGATATAAETVEGKFGRLKLMFDETKESIGAKLLPALSNVGTWIFEKGIPAVRKFAEDMLPKLRDIWDSIKKTIDDNRPGLEKLGRVLATVGGFVLTKVVPAFLKWQGIITGVLIKALGKLGEVMPPIAAGFLRGLAGIVKGFGNLYSAALTALSGILTVAERTMGWIPGIGEKITAAKSGFESFRSDSVAKLGAVETALLGAATAVEAVGTEVTNLPEAKLKADIADLSTKLSTAKTALNDKDLTKERKAELKADIANLSANLATAKTKLDGIKGKTVTVGVAVVFSRSGQSFVRMPPGSRYAGKVFPLASGGIVTRPTLALIGEAGPEAVVPLSKSAPAPLTATGPLQVNLYLDGRQIQRALVDLQNATGRAVIPAVA